MFNSYKSARRARLIFIWTLFAIGFAAFCWLMLGAPLDELFCDVERSATACMLEPEP